VILAYKNTVVVRITCRQRAYTNLSALHVLAAV
jgi:hypothetical protein